MTDLAQMTADERLDETMALCKLIEAQGQGRGILVLAFGEDFYVGQPMGEIAASNDRERIGTQSRYVAQIVEALRFARALPEHFLSFVEKNRREHDAAPECPDVLGETSVDGTLPCFVQCPKCLGCHGW